MNIKVRTFANLRDVIGKGEIEYQVPSGSTLGGVLQKMSEDYGEGFEKQITDPLTGDIIAFLLLVNGQSYRSTADLDKEVADGDTVTIMIPFDGGGCASLARSEPA
jgi:MoaD family protein